LFEGILGLPVFSNSPEKGVGLIYFTGPTMGYLIGFLTACYLASKIDNKDSFLLVLSKLTIATINNLFIWIVMVRNSYRDGISQL
jgi:biotin transport system substrate-specific component